MIVEGRVHPLMESKRCRPWYKHVEAHNVPCTLPLVFCTVPWQRTFVPALPNPSIVGTWLGV